MSARDPGRWLLLIHQLPPKPDYVRVKVRRRLQRLGAVPLKSSVYALPASDEALEDFQWLSNEIVTDGGDATICAASLLSGVTDDDLEAAFRAEREAEYRSLIEEASAEGEAGPERIARLRRKLAGIAQLDWFGAPARVEAERALVELERRPHGAEVERGPSAMHSDRPNGATWVTRSGVFVDRIASAWLIRRYIDPTARFEFVAARGYRPLHGELRFDMPGGEYTHEGDHCTFETLLARFGLGDPALTPIAEIVHDIDLKDEKFGRPEAAGLAAILAGIARAQPDDGERIRLGAAIFDGLHAQFAR
jgi:hypothetical protein